MHLSPHTNDLACCAIKGGCSVVDSLFIVAPIVCWGSVFGPCFVIHYFMSFQFYNLLNGEGGAGCCTLSVFNMFCDC